MYRETSKTEHIAIVEWERKQAKFTRHLQKPYNCFIANSVKTEIIIEMVAFSPRKIT